MFSGVKFPEGDPLDSENTQQQQQKNSVSLKTKNFKRFIQVVKSVSVQFDVFLKYL